MSANTIVEKFFHFDLGHLSYQPSMCNFPLHFISNFKHAGYEKEGVGQFRENALTEAKFFLD